MNLLILTDRYPPYYEGAYELNCQQITDYLLDKGHTCTVLTTTYGLAETNQDRQRVTEANIHRRLSFHRMYESGGIERRQEQMKMPWQALQNSAITKTLLRQIQPDLVFVWQMTTASISPILAAQKLGFKTSYRIGSHWLVHQRNGYVNEPKHLQRWYRRGLLAFKSFAKLNLDHSIFVSRSLQQDHLDAGFQMEDIAVIPSGLPREWIDATYLPRTTEQSGCKVLFVGRIEEAKGPDIAIEAMDHLRHHLGVEDVTLDLVGKGDSDYTEGLRRELATRDLSEAVRLIGPLSRQEVLRRYRQYDVLLFPTRSFEGMPMSILEAMARGVTVIASDIGGPRDILQEGETGFLVPPEDSVQFAQMLATVAQNPHLRARIGAAAVRQVRQQHTFERTAQAYERFLYRTEQSASIAMRPSPLKVMQV